MPYRLTTPQQLGTILSARRKARGQSQATLAAKLGLSQNRLSELEHHPETLTLDRLLTLANVLGLELLIREKEEPSSSKVSSW